MPIKYILHIGMNYLCEVYKLQSHKGTGKEEMSNYNYKHRKFNQV